MQFQCCFSVCECVASHSSVLNIIIGARLGSLRHCAVCAGALKTLAEQKREQRARWGKNIIEKKSQSAGEKHTINYYENAIIQIEFKRFLLQKFVSTNF